MKTAMIYVLLVGAPLLGLLGILRAGERIVPPRHVGGEWVLEPGFAAAVRAACPGLVFPAAGPSLDVSQSGTRAVLTLNDTAATTLDARLDGDSLAAATRRGSAACGGRGLRLAATLHADPQGPQLSGAAAVPGCAACGPVPFRATRGAATSTR
jgi:hypothetical protein